MRNLERVGGRGAWEKNQRVRVYRKLAPPDVTRQYHPDMPRWVLLRHDTPDGRWHYDWMMEPELAREGALITFRVFVRPDDPGVLGFEAQRLPDHRRVYLDYEGPISGDRGRVSRISEGECQVVIDGATFEVELLTPTHRRLVGMRREPAPDVYTFTAP